MKKARIYRHSMRMKVVVPDSYKTLSGRAKLADIAKVMQHCVTEAMRYFRIEVWETMQVWEYNTWTCAHILVSFDDEGFTDFPQTLSKVINSADNLSEKQQIAVLFFRTVAEKLEVCELPTVELDNGEVYNLSCKIAPSK